jgi:hypothetical protein
MSSNDTLVDFATSSLTDASAQYPNWIVFELCDADSIFIASA